MHQQGRARRFPISSSSVCISEAIVSQEVHHFNCIQSRGISTSTHNVLVPVPSCSRNASQSNVNSGFVPDIEAGDTEEEFDEDMEVITQIIASRRPLVCSSILYSKIISKEAKDNPMDLWLPHVNRFLNNLIQHKGQNLDALFCLLCCEVSVGIYHCKECVGNLLLCIECCLSQHEQLPLHHILV